MGKSIISIICIAAIVLLCLIGRGAGGKAPKYYFVGYNVEANTEHGIVIGNMYWVVNDGLFPNKNEIIAWIRKADGYQSEKIVVLSISEFPNKAALDRFYK